jgi:NO-binding membrane sensor protein with MHYT domain
MEHLPSGQNPIFIALSIVIAILASYAALEILERVKTLSGAERRNWLLGGAGIFGFGVWSMHFIGMIGYMLPVNVQYNYPVVMLSILPIVLAAYFVLDLLARPTVSMAQILLGGVLLGLGVGGMHYGGMFAMQMNATLSFDPIMFAVSVLVAVGVSTAGLLTLTSSFLAGSAYKQVVTAIVTGAAIPIMHYVAMAASRFTPAADQMQMMNAPLLPFGNLVLVNVVVVATLLVLSLPALLNFRTAEA